MKTVIAIVIIFIVASSSAMMAEEAPSERKWVGIDESVVEAIAAKAGRPARDPYINTDQGDLLLFVFLIAGLIAGFIIGYYYQILFASDAVKNNGAKLR